MSLVGSIIGGMFALFVVAAVLAIHHVVVDRDDYVSTKPKA